MKISIVKLLRIIPIFCGSYIVQGQQLKNRSFTYLTSDQIKTPVTVSGAGYPCMFVPGGPGGGFRSFEKLGGANLENL